MASSSMQTSSKQTTRFSFPERPSIFPPSLYHGWILILELKVVSMMAWISMHTPGFSSCSPFYLWLLIGCIILACRYSQSVAKRLGQNPVAVLATLLLMSYSKILSAVIVPLTWSYLTYYTLPQMKLETLFGFMTPAYSFSKNLSMLHSDFLLSYVVIFVVPYIFLLFFGHWL